MVVTTALYILFLVLELQHVSLLVVRETRMHERMGEGMACPNRQLAKGMGRGLAGPPPATSLTSCMNKLSSPW